VILICGPPDSGVTTLSIVALHSVDPYLYSVYNLADMRGKELINVTEFKPEPGHDMELTFDRILRREADVLFLNPLTSPQDAQTIFQYSDRLSFIMEIPANTPIEAMQKLISWVGVDEVVKGLKCILTQKLIRKLCDDCKQAFRPNPLLLKKLGLPPETSVLYRAPVPPPPEDVKAQTVEELCADCDGVPYHGRVAAFEMLEMTDTMKEVIAAGGDPEAIRRQMTADGQTTLQKDAIRLVADGKTSLEEIQRTFNPGGSGAKKKPMKARPKPPALG
jgi:type IV pilus assembly protein PilB